MELVMFLIFSTLEVFAAFVFMMAIFRENPMDYIWQALVIALLMGFQSHFLRGIDLGYVATVINLLCYVLLLATVVRIPILWAGIISCTGFFVYATVQGILLGIIGGQLLQLVTSIFFLLLSYVLYKFGIGFAANYDQLRLRREKLLIMIVIGASFVLTAVTMYQSDIWINIIFFGAASTLFLYYAVRKEMEE